MDDDEEAGTGAPAASTVLPHSPARSDDIFSDDSPPPAAAATPAPASAAAPAAAADGGAGAQAPAIPGKPAVIMTAGRVAPCCLPWQRGSVLLSCCSRWWCWYFEYPHSCTSLVKHANDIPLIYGCSQQTP